MVAQHGRKAATSSRGARQVIVGVQHVFKDISKASFADQTLDAKATLEFPWIQDVHIAFAKEGTTLDGGRVARVAWEGPRSFVDREEASRLCDLNLHQACRGPRDEAGI